MAKLTKAWAGGASPRAHIWADVPDEKWNDWRWQLSHRVNDLEVLETFINLTEEEIEGISEGARANVIIITLIDKAEGDPSHLFAGAVNQFEPGAQGEIAEGFASIDLAPFKICNSSPSTSIFM